MTTGMLPRLQELHDKAECLVFLATNIKEVIDPAVRREGRFDFKLQIDHPLCPRALEYLDEPDTRIRREIAVLARSRVDGIIVGVKQAVTHYIAEKGGETRIPFKNIENALRSAARGPDHEITARARRVLEVGIDMDPPDLEKLD